MRGGAVSGNGVASTGGRAAGVAYGLAAVAIWSGTFVLTRLGVRTTLNAYDLTALRFGFAALLLMPAMRREGFALARLGWPGLALLIAGTGAPYALLIAAGLSRAPAGDAAVLLPGAMAVIAAILGLLVLGERLQRAGWLGVALILLGSLLVTARAPAPGEGLGHVALVAAGLLWAGNVIVLRRARLAALQATAIVAVGSAAIYLPIYLAVLPSRLAAAPFADIALQTIYQGGVTAVLGYVAFNRAVLLLGVASGAALPALVPLTTLLLARLVLGEAPRLPDVAAAVLVGLGVLLVTAARSPVTPPWRAPGSGRAADRSTARR